MNGRFMWCLALSVTAATRLTFAQEQETKYGFATKKYSIQMKVAFYRPYAGTRLMFSNPADPKAAFNYFADNGPARDCLERFVGAVALVTYSVKLASGVTPNAVVIREGVTVLVQSSNLPARAPFSMSQKLINGIGSDIQAFGYDETPLKRANRVQTRRLAKAAWWRLCRQELYLDEETKPFAIAEWKYTLERITLVRIYSPPDPE